MTIIIPSICNLIPLCQQTEKVSEILVQMKLKLKPTCIWVVIKGSNTSSKHYSAPLHTSWQADIQLAAGHLRLQAAAKAWEGGAAATGPAWSRPWAGTRILVSRLWGAALELLAPRASQASSEGRRPLGGRGVRGVGLLRWDGEDMIRIHWWSQGAPLLEQGKTNQHFKENLCLNANFLHKYYTINSRSVVRRQQVRKAE